MRKEKRVLAACCLLLALAGFTGTARGVYLDAERNISFTGKVQTRNSIRTQDSSGFTWPSVAACWLVQQRNLLYLELNHDLDDLRDKVVLLKPLQWADIDVKYRLVGRFLYEGIYDYGPKVFREVQDENKGEIEDFKMSAELWEGYGDFSRGPVFFRIGKQNLAWGETDIFRLLDMINPLDNTYGGIFEDLDDRRIPLLMVRGSYNLGALGPVDSLTVEAFWVPGFWETTVSPLAPEGTPYALPLPPSPLDVRVLTPDHSMSNSRWGFRLMGTAGGVNFSLCHYKTFMDNPTPRVAVTPGLPVLLNPADAWQEITFEDVQITGGSANYWESHLDVVLRAEVAWFWNEAVFIPEENLKVSDTLLPLPPPLMELLPEGISGLPIRPTGGTIPRKNILRYMIGFDKQLWIRPLNRTQTFLISMQYFAQWIPDYDPGISQPVPLPPDPLNFATVREYEQTFTGLVNTTYLNGSLNPQIALAYDVRGVWLFQPSVSYIWEPFRFMIQYSLISGNLTNFGVFRDRDQLSFIFAYLLN